MTDAAVRNDAHSPPSRWHGMMPALRWRRNYERDSFRADLTAGVALPAHLPNAVLVGLTIARGG